MTHDSEQPTLDKLLKLANERVADFAARLEQLEEERRAALESLPSVAGLAELDLESSSLKELADCLNGVRDALEAQGRLLAELRSMTR